MAITKKPITLQKIKTKSLSYVKSWGWWNKNLQQKSIMSIKSQGKVLVGYNRKTYHFTNDQDKEVIWYSKLKVLK